MANKKVTSNAKSRRRQLTRAEPETPLVKEGLDVINKNDTEPETFELGDEQGGKEGLDIGNNDNTVAEPNMRRNAQTIDMPRSQAAMELIPAKKIDELLRGELAKRGVKPDIDTPEEERVPSEQEFNSLAEVKASLGGVSLSWNWFGVERMVGKAANAKAAAALNTTAGLIKTRRELIDKSMEEWKRLQEIRTGCTQTYNSMTFKYVIEGQRLFRLDMKEQVWSTVKKYQADLVEAAARFHAKRDDIIKWAKDNLGDCFDETLYPSDFTKFFSVTIREHSIEPPSYLRHTNAEEYQQTLRRTLMDVRNSMLDFEKQCSQQIGQSIGRVMNALTNGTALHESNLINVQNTFARIAMMKFEGTQAFKATMEAAEKVVEKVSIQDLRRSAGARQEVRDKLRNLLEEYKALRATPDA